MADQLEETLGHNVRARRIAAGLSQAEVAERANVSVGAVKHLEQGSGSTLRTLTRVLRVLGAEGWLDQLAPAPARFDPLELLDARTPGPAARPGPGPPPTGGPVTYRQVD